MTFSANRAAPRVMPGAEPFYFKGTAAGCLLLHGFTATPQELRGLGEHLAACGYTVHAPRLPHHGTQPADLTRSRWWDWQLAAQDALLLLRAHCTHVAVIGLSLGGMLALQLAAEQSVAAVIALSTPYTIPADWRVALLRQISHVHPYMKKTSATASWVDPQALQRRVQYGVRPLRAMAEVVDYLRVLPELLPAVTAPALLIHSNADRAVTPADMQRICDRLGSRHKEMLLLARGDHVITEDVERAQVFAAVEKFLAQQMPA